MPSYQSVYDGSQHDMYATKAALIDLIYPVGAIYISYTNVNPSNLFGGTWEQIKDKFILAAGDTYGGGTTGGAASVSHTHTAAHSHSLGAGYARIVFHGAGKMNYSERVVSPTWNSNYKASGVSVSTESISEQWGCGLGGSTDSTTPTTSSTSISTMPPYFTVYMYRRIS